MVFGIAALQRKRGIARVLWEVTLFLLSLCPPCALQKNIPCSCPEVRFKEAAPEEGWGRWLCRHIAILDDAKNRPLHCFVSYDRMLLGAIVATGGGSAFQSMSTYRLPYILEVMSMGKIQRKDSKYCWYHYHYNSHNGFISAIDIWYH